MDSEFLGSSHKTGPILQTKVGLYKDVFITHSYTFSILKDNLKDKKVVLLGPGTSLSIFRRIDNAIYIGLNAAAYHPMHLDYICLQDNFTGTIDRAVARQNSTQILCGKNIFDNMNQIDVEQTFNNALKFYTAYFSTITYPQLRVNILEEPVDVYSLTIFALLQIVLWCLPKEIYLVGFDCDGSGSFLGHTSGGNFARVLPVWRAIKIFIKANYPQIKVIAVNPSGLKGLFIDLYQDQEEMQAIYMLSEKDCSIVKNYIDTAIKNNQHHPGIAALVLKLWRDRGNYIDAAKHARHLVRLSGYKGYEAFLELAASSHNNNKAIEIANKVLYEQPEIFFTHAYLSIKEWLSGKSDFWTVIMRSDAVAELRPYWIMAMRYGWGFFRNIGQHKAALACAHEVLTLSPQSLSLKIELFDYLTQRWSYKEAKNLAFSCLKYQPKWPEGFYMLARIAQTNNNEKEAIKFLSKAVDLAPLLFIYRIRLAEMFRSFNRIDDAHAVINEALKVSPTWYDGYYQRAQNFLANYKNIAAIENIQVAINLLPIELIGFRPYRESLAYLLLAIDEIDKAENFTRETLAIVPEWGMGWKILSEIYVRKCKN